MQPELNFDQPNPAGGLEIWREARKRQLDEVARRLGLPLGSRCEVWLRGGIRLRGTLRLQEELLMDPEGLKVKVPLEISGVTFTQDEIEGGCTRID